MDEEAEAAYESEGDYYEEDEEYDEEVEEEEKETDEEEEPEIDFEAEIEEPEEKLKYVIQKINENDKNHKIIKIRPPHLRITSHVIQVSEYVEAVGIRCTQIENGAPVFTDTTGYSSPIEMAKLEFIRRKSPLILVRVVRDDGAVCEVEEFPVREMTFPVSDREILNITETQVRQLLYESSAKSFAKNKFRSDPNNNILDGKTEKNKNDK